MEIHNLEKAAEAASCGDVGSQKLLALKGLLLAKAITEALCLQPGEEVHWFFSPYRKEQSSEGWKRFFVIPEPNVKYGFDVLYAMCWIQKEGVITSTLKIYICFEGYKRNLGFPYNDVRYAIGSGMFFPLEYISEMVCNHLRHGKSMQGGLSCETNYVEEDVLPLLQK